MQECNLLSPSPHSEPDHATGNGGQVIGKILSAHAWTPLDQHVIRAGHITSSIKTNRSYGRVIDNARKLRIERDAHRTAQRLGGAVAQFRYSVASISRNHEVQGADRSFHRHGVWDDIRRMAALDLANSNNQGIARIGLSRKGLIDERDKLRGDRDRINRVMRTRPMTSPAADFDLKILAKRCLRTSGQRELSRSDCRIDMQGDDRIDSIERAALNHLPRAVTNFLRGLEDATPADRNRAHRIQPAQGPKQNRRMSVVAAGVHDTGISRAIRNVVLLGDGQRINVRAEGDNGSLGRRGS